MVEVHKAHEGLHLCDVLWCRPVLDPGNINGIHLYPSFRENYAQIFNCGALKCAFLHLEVEPMLLEYVQDSGHDLLMVFDRVSVY